MQAIADFENELKTYQGGLKKEAYYFYKSCLPVSGFDCSMRFFRVFRVLDFSCLRA